VNTRPLLDQLEETMASTEKLRVLLQSMLAKIVGSKPLPRSEVTKKIWDYIKKNKLQDAKKKTLINADDALKAVFGGKKQVTMFEMTKHVSGHVK